MIAAGFAPSPRMTMADQMWPMVAFSGALCVLALAGMTVDDRLLGGVGVWVKPLKFSVSFVVYFATLALVVDRMSAAARRGWTLRIALGAAVVAMISEMGYLFVSAGQGVASHFNFSSAFRIQMYSLMGVGAVLLVLAVGIVGWLAWRDREARLGPGLRLGVLLGFGASTVLTLVTAGALSMNGGHFVGVPGDGAGTLPLFGWSTAVGDLRPAHFLALHAMQAIPLIGWLADRRGWRAAAVTGGTLGYAALTLAVFAQALAGLPLFRL
jgi:hypothetical protein